MNQEGHITELLLHWQKGDQKVEAELLALIEKDLRKVVRQAMYHPGPRGFHLQTTEMVNELYLRLRGGKQGTPYKDRGHFFSLCARQVRQILVDMYRERKAQKRGGGVEDLVLDASLIPSGRRGFSIGQLEDALSDFEKLDPEKALVVELRFYIGLSNEEIAEALEVSVPTVKRRWKYARAWLYDHLTNVGPGAAP